MDVKIVLNIKLRLSFNKIGVGKLGFYIMIF